MNPVLHIVMYHYVRDLPNTPFPRIKGMLTSDFQRQLSVLTSRYEMATLESALAFLQGQYIPCRDLCLLTFDDGLKEHYAEVTPILVDAGVQGLFFVITRCVQEHQVAPVHMNHFLMAALDFDSYRSAFLRRLQEVAPHASTATAVDPAVVQRAYRWDSPEIATFKYFFNFIIDTQIRDRVLHSLFEEEIGTESSFSQTLYFNWDEAKQMQVAGMLIGGHSHQHRPLATLSDEELQWDLRTCQRLLSENVRSQTLWPFCYPYGKRDSFNAATIKQLEQLEYACAFSSELGANLPGSNAFTLHRLDCKDAPPT